MPYYLAEIVEGRQLPFALGGGVFERRASRKPAGIDSPASRNWVYVGDRALLWASDAIADPRLTKLADDSNERLTAATRDILGELAGRQFGAQDRFDDSVVATLRSGRFGEFRPSKKRSRFEVRLGPDKLLWTEFSAPRKNTKTYVDTFDRANSSTLGTSSDGLFTWTEAGTVLAITGNLLTATNIPDGGDASATTSAECDTDDLYSQVQLVTFTRNSGSLGVFLYVATDDGSTGYIFSLINDGAFERAIYRASTFDLLDSDATSTTSGTLLFHRDGASILAHVNGVEILSATNSAESSGSGFRKSALLAFADSTSTNDAAWNDFGYGDLDAGGGGGVSTQTVTENTTVIDQRISGARRPRQHGDSTVVGDGTVSGAHRPRQSGEVVVIAESFGGSFTLRGAVFSDNVALNDAITQFRRVSRQHSDAFSVADQALYFRRVVRLVNDAATLIEQIISDVETAALRIVVTESVAVVDDILRIVFATRNAPDGVSVADAALLAAYRTRLNGEQIQALDQLGEVLRRSRDVFEVVSLTDDILSLRWAVRLISEALDVSEEVARNLVVVYQVAVLAKVGFDPSPLVRVGAEQVGQVGMDEFIRVGGLTLQ